MHINHEDNEINMVENGYKKYKVQIIKSGGFSTSRDYATIEAADEGFVNACQECPDKLVELFTLDWTNKILDVRWHKKFTYGMGAKRIIPARPK